MPNSLRKGLAVLVCASLIVCSPSGCLKAFAQTANNPSVVRAQASLSRSPVVAPVIQGLAGGGPILPGFSLTLLPGAYAWTNPLARPLSPVALPPSEVAASFAAAGASLSPAARAVSLPGARAALENPAAYREPAAIRAPSGEKPATPLGERPLFKALSAPSLSIPRNASAEQAALAAEADFLAHLGGAAPENQPQSIPWDNWSVSRAKVLPGGSPRTAPTSPGTMPETSYHPAERQNRSALFALVLAAISGATLVLLTVVPAAIRWAFVQAVPAAPSPEAGISVLGIAALVLAAATAFLGVLALWDLGLFWTAMWRGSDVRDKEFYDYAKARLNQLGLHPSVISTLLGRRFGQGVLKIAPPRRGFWDFSWGFRQGRAIYARPEVVRLRPRWLRNFIFDQWIKHELTHFSSDFGRGPPAPPNWIIRFLRWLKNEVRAYFFGELRTLKSMRTLHIPALDRVLYEAQVSLRLKAPYDLLIVHPSSSQDMLDPAQYAGASGGRARIVGLQTSPGPGAGGAYVELEGAALTPAGPRGPPEGQPPSAPALADYLSRESNRGRFKRIVFPQSFGAIPPSDSREGARLSLALKQLDEVYLLSQRLKINGQVLDQHSLEAREFERLTGMVARMRRNGQFNSKKFEAILAQLIFKISRTQLQGIGLVRTVESLYEGLRHKGVVMLPFSHTDPGLDTMEKLLKYWRGKDGGSFRVERVDLAEGGHVLVAHKMEPRVNLWVKPVEGHRIAASDVDVPEAPEAQEAVLRQAGFGDAEIQRFREAGMEIQFVFGEDYFGEHGGSKIFVSVPRINAKMLKRYAEESGFQFHASRGGIGHHLLDSVPLQRVPAVWKMGRRGKGMLIGHVDTGVDAAHPDFRGGQIEAEDVTGEGLEDWDEHGSHTAGDSYADGSAYKGPAPAASGVNAKVFPRGSGTSDGYIMAGWVKLMQKGAHVISSSLGSPGSVNSPLAKAASELTQKKNARGYKPVMVASRGNSGPVNLSVSQPSSGEYVNSVAAATKKKRIAFFSSVAPVLDTSFSLEFIRFPFGITGIGGNVRTLPNQKDVYDQGVESVKSQYGQPSPSDTPDHKRRRMSGTSMSAPQIAGIAADVEEELLSVVKPGHPAYDFVMENLPYVVNMMLFASAEDLGVPIWHQESGFVDAEAALLLVRATFGRPSASGAKPWDWISRTQKVYAMTRRVFEEAEGAKQEKIDELSVRFAERTAQLEPLAASGDKDAAGKLKEIRREIGDKAGVAMVQGFKQARINVSPELIQDLKDENWLVRQYAAHALLNLKDPSQNTVNALAEVALNDPDGRVRQSAFFALARIQSYSVDELLFNATRSRRPDVAIYAAYALARHGELSGLNRIQKEVLSPDESVRYSATWLLGQLGRRTPQAVSETLNSRVKDETEIDEVRHMAVISLSEMALASPAAVSDEAVLGLLSSAGPQNFALTRTITKFFQAAVRSKDLRDRLRSDPLKGAITDFVHAYKPFVNKPGVLGEFVAMLARIINLPLDMPTPVPNPEGIGVPGVDSNLGDIHLIVELPENQAAAPRIERFQDFRGAEARTLAEAAASFGLEPEMMARHQAALQAAMPASQSLWLNVPDSKALALTSELEARGYQVHRARPVYAHIHEVGPLLKIPEMRRARGLTGKGVLVVYADEGGDVSYPGIAPERIEAKRNFTDDGGVEEVDRESVGHGTHGMVIVGGAGVDGSPYVGMAPEAHFAIAKMLGTNGGSEAQAMAALEWGASLVPDPSKRPVIFNASWGGRGPADNPLNRLVTRLKLKNYQFLAAAGNEGPGEDTVSSPANAPLATAISAIAKNGKLPFYPSRSTPEKQEIARVNYGGAVSFDLPNPYEIVSGLSTRLADAMRKAPTTVLWKGEPLYQYMSGTSMASPAEAGVQAVLAERAAEVLMPDLGGLPNGFWLWLDRLISEEADPMPDNAAHEVGAGRTDPERALAALDDALKNPQRVAAEAEALAREAQAKYGHLPPQPPGRRWFRRLLPLEAAAAMWWALILPAAVLFLH